MRIEQFPFAKYRGWKDTPEELPNLDTTDLLELGNWHASIYKRPVHDDITAYPNFYPSHNGIIGYTQRPVSRTLAKASADALGISEKELEDRRARQALHVAESAELGAAISWTAANIRASALVKAISAVNDNVERDVPKYRAIDDDTAVYAADAIADYGYCLRNPSDPDHLGNDHGPALAQQINRIADDIGSKIEQFGLYAGDYPEVLETSDGLTLMEITLEEQERRISYWSKRHNVIEEVFVPRLALSTEILLERVPLEEIIEIQSQIKRN